MTLSTLSVDMLYWSFMGVAFIVTGIVGITIMLLTQKIGRAFWWSLAVNALIFIAASVWYYQISDAPFRHTLGRLLFYVIAFINIEVLIGFALLTLRKNHDS